jgi:pimeloyl-ACP methyl ester carboxylesterase
MSTGTVTVRALGREAEYRGVRVRTPDGLSIAVQDWARPTSTRDVLLIHGYSQCHLSWLKQVSGPLAEEFRLVTYDCRGHGSSDKPLEPHFYREPERWAAEIEAVIQGVGLRRPALVFWSYAGRVVLDYVTCRGDAGVSCLVFVNATSKADSTVLGPATSLLRSMTHDDLATNIDATTALLRQCAARPLPEDELRYMLAFNMVVPAAIRANLAGRAAKYEVALRSLRVPVLAIHGSEDPVNLLSMADYTASMAPNVHRITYPGVGHMPFWEAAETFDRDLGAFLRSLG